MIYTVKTVSPDTREWSSKQGGTFVSYTIDLEDEKGILARGVEWSRKPESRAPQEGEQVAGHLEEGRFGEKFRMDYQATKEIGQGGSSASASSGASKAPQGGRDLDASIARQVALKVLAESINGEDELTPELRQYVEEIETFILEAGKAASQGAGASAPSHAQASSPATTPAPEKPPAEDLADIEMALSETPSGSFMGAGARSLVAEYMQTQLAPDDLLRACNQLTNKGDQEQQEMTFRAMCKRTERWKGQPLPTAPQPDDDIPF